MSEKHKQTMRVIRFTYKDTERVALEIEADDRMIDAMHCLQASKDGVNEVGHRTFKVPEMRDIRLVHDVTGLLQQNPDFLTGVQAEIRNIESTTQAGRKKR
jgi:hypothetical protein